MTSRFTVEEFDAEARTRYVECYDKVPDRVRFLPGGVVLQRNMENFVDKIVNLQLRSDDIWVVTPPKCGTTWIQVGESL